MHVPRTVDEFLAHAEELAARFEDVEQDAADEVDADAAPAANRVRRAV
jgi:hypothetical protein